MTSVSSRSSPTPEQRLDAAIDRVALAIPHQLPPSADGFVYPKEWEPFVEQQKNPLDRKLIIEEGDHYIWLAGKDFQVDITNWKLPWIGKDGKEKLLTFAEKAKDPELQE